jgi:hypothetical protein
MQEPEPRLLLLAARSGEHAFEGEEEHCGQDAADG